MFRPNTNITISQHAKVGQSSLGGRLANVQLLIPDEQPCFDLRQILTIEFTIAKVELLLSVVPTFLLDGRYVYDLSPVHLYLTNQRLLTIPDRPKTFQFSIRMIIFPQTLLKVGVYLSG